MPKIEAGVTPAQSFQIDGIPFQRGGYELVVKGDNIGINRMNARSISSSILVSPLPFGDWTDSSDMAYISVAAMIADVETFIFKP